MSDISVGCIKTDIERSDYDATQIESTAFNLEAKVLNAKDEESTIGANLSFHSVFDSSQTLIASLGEAMGREVSNIRSIGMSFDQCDHALAGTAAQTEN